MPKPTIWTSSNDSNLELTASVPVVGMGLTVRLFTDRVALTIVSVSASGKTFTATKDTAIRVDSNGMSESQDYEYSPNPKAEGIVFRWSKKHQAFKSGIGIAGLGYRKAYHDFSF